VRIACSTSAAGIAGSEHQKEPSELFQLMHRSAAADTAQRLAKEIDGLQRFMPMDYFTEMEGAE
jgi:hypothetical protein